MTPKGRCTVFSASLPAWEASRAHRFHRKCPKFPKSAQNGGTPPFDQFFRKLTLMHPTNSQIFGKNYGFSPRWAIHRGEKPHFFPKIGEDEGCIYVSFPESCFLYGGPV